MQLFLVLHYDVISRQHVGPTYQSSIRLLRRPDVFPTSPNVAVLPFAAVVEQS